MNTQNTNTRELYISDDAIEYISSKEFTEEERLHVSELRESMTHNQGLDYDGRTFSIVDDVDQIIAEEDEDSNHNLDLVGVSQVNKKLGINQW